ncbi:MAG TPA: hypothetical protein PK120_06165 [Syntrophales bacterium]|nr:hypothetical protein [Syntrophales bacterium]
MGEQTLVYEVDREDIIVSIEGPWDRFAAANGGKAPARAETIGRNLFDFIRGPEVAHVYRAMHDVLRAKPEKQIVFSYRCDAPDLKRHMTMEMYCSENRIVYRSTLEREEPISPPVYIDYDSTSGEIVVMCAFCKRFRYPSESDQWSPIDDLLARVPPAFEISHSICPVCFRLRYGEESDSP